MHHSPHEIVVVGNPDAAGLVPLLPDRLAYPELVAERLHDAVLCRHSLFDRLRVVLEDLPAARGRVDGLRESTRRFSWEAVAPLYDAELEGLVSRSGP